MKFNQAKQYSAVSSLALIMAVRMLGLFMILPVFSVHVEQFKYASAELMGLALGIYGLSQGLLQMPFAMLSDRFGRKLMIAIGLLIFLIGSIYAAMTHNVYGLIIGRALQGAGAIGSTVLAMVADLTEEENRSKAMGIIGLGVGASFAVAMMVGPVLNAWDGLSGIFWVTAGLALICLILLWLVVPQPPILFQNNPLEKHGLPRVLRNVQLLRLDASIFILHAILTSLFIAVPLLLTQFFKLDGQAQMLFYLSVLVLAFALMLPLMIMAEKKRQMRRVFIGAIATLLVSQLFLWSFHQNLWTVSLLLLIFFIAFSLLEATLPSWISKLTSIRNKGAAMGVYSTSQFLGIFVGGSLGGWIFAHFAIAGIFAFGAVLSLIWLGLVFSIPQPPYLSTVTLKLHEFGETVNIEQLAAKIYGIAGIVEVSILQTSALISLKIDQNIITQSQLRQSLENSKLITNS